jgi:hypothetical protein
VKEGIEMKKNLMEITEKTKLIEITYLNESVQLKLRLVNTKRTEVQVVYLAYHGTSY